MTIASVDDYIAAAKQSLSFYKTAGRTAVAAGYTSVFDLAGVPQPAGAAFPNPGNNGEVPVAGGAGYLPINAFAGGASGYLSRVSFGWSVAGRMRLYDRLWDGGQYAFNAGTVAVVSPSYAARIPNGDYGAANLELWAEIAVAFTGGGTPTVTVGYTNQDGVAGRSATAAAPSSNPIAGRMWQVPLQAGDTGIQSIQSMQISGASLTAGAVLVSVMRRLWSGRVTVGNMGDMHDLLRTGMPQVFATSAFFLLCIPDSISTALPDLRAEIASK